MNPTAGGPAGLMVLRVWTEPGQRMRARLTRTDDLTSGRPVSSYAASAPEVLTLVEQWLSDVTALDADGEPPVTPP